MINLEQDEHVILEIRKHWFVIATEIFSLVLLALAPLVLIGIYNAIPVKIIITNGSLIFLTVFLYSAWIFVLWIVGFIFWTNYYLDAWLLTNKKLLDVEQLGLFRRQISMLHLDKIQDVKTETHGILATIINYGDVNVQTAAQQRNFIIHHAPHPDVIRQKLVEALTKYRDHTEKDNIPPTQYLS